MNCGILEKNWAYCLFVPARRRTSEHIRRTSPSRTGISHL